MATLVLLIPASALEIGVLLFMVALLLVVIVVIMVIVFRG